MNLRQLTELAALASAYSPHLIEGNDRLSDAALHGFWNQTRRALYVWLRCLNRCQADIDSAALTHLRSSWTRVEPVIEDVFVSEILSRVWSAVLTAGDHRRRCVHAAPIAHSVLLGHFKARQLAMSLLVKCPCALSSRAARLDRLRRKSERWTDLLLGHLIVQYPVACFAFDAARAHDFGNEHLTRGFADPNGRVWDFVLAGLRLAFPTRSTRRTGDDDFSSRIAGSVMATFPADAFAVDGPFKSVLHGRIARSGLVPEMPPTPTKSHPRPAKSTAKEPASGAGKQGIRFSDLQRRYGRQR